MTSVYQNDKAKNNEIYKHQWVRVKQQGLYNGDIGLVVATADSNVWLRIIPRIEQMSQLDKKGGKSFFRRPPQQFNFKPKKLGGVE